MTHAVHRARGRRAARPGAIALAALAAAIGGAAFSADAALAGEYPMYACDVPGINLAAPTTSAWVPYNAGATGVGRYEDCSTRSRGGQQQWHINYPTGVLAQNTGVGMGLTIPASGAQSAISIARVTDWSATQLTAQSAGQAPALGKNLAPSISAAPGGDASGFDGTGTSGVGHDSGPLPANAKSHQLGVMCAYYGAGHGHCTLPNPILRVRGIRTMLQEAEQPAGAIDGGSLTSGTAVRGTKTVAYTVSDDESGVEKVQALLDDVVVGGRSFARDLTRPVAEQTGECTYVGLRACPATHSDLLTVNTGLVPDGAYELRLRTTDAAGNSRTTVAGAPVLVDNVPDSTPPTGPAPVGNVPGPTGPAGPAGSNGANGRDGAVVRINGVNGSSSASLKAAFAGSRRGTIRSAYGKKVLITGRLVAPGGKPITGARLWVMQQDKMVGARMLPAGEVVTDRAGTFRYVTTALRSRTIRFGYRADLDAVAFSQTTDIGLGVVARIGLKPSRTALRNGQSVVFRGRVAGAPANARKVVELQVRKGSSWMTFRSTRLRSGRFTERYRFTRTRGRATYRFRARVRQEAGFPFLTGVSKTAKVTVRG